MENKDKSQLPTDDTVWLEIYCSALTGGQNTGVARSMADVGLTLFKERFEK